LLKPELTIHLVRNDQGRGNFGIDFASQSREAERPICEEPPEVTVTPQEEQLLNSLIDRLNQTPLQEKDPDAEALLNERLAENPDALYMLAQTVLVQNIALEQAKAQINQLQQLQQQRPQPAHATSFLGRLLGERDEQPLPPPQQQAPASGYQPVPSQYVAAQPQYGAPQYQQPQHAPAGQPSFLRGAMQTAAGVAAGALAFEGIESMLHGFGHGGYGWGGPGIGGFGERPVEVINNYYDEPGHGAEHTEHHSGQFGDAGYNPQNNDPGDNLRGFDNQNAGPANDVNAFGDTSGFADQSLLDDQAGLDDQALNDGSGFDDSGSFDDGGGGLDDSGGF
jgi:uncharacterized protein